MNTARAALDFEAAKIATKERMLRELASDLAALVESGDLTDEQANEWMVCKQDQWFGGDR